MSNHQGPRAGSRAYIVLSHLFVTDSRINVVELRRAAAPKLTMGEFQHTVLGSLRRFGYVREEESIISITPAGKRYMQPPAVETVVKPVVVPGRYVAPMAELSKRFSARPLVIREGAFDYRNVPSLHGDQRLPYAAPRSVISAERK